MAALGGMIGLAVTTHFPRLGEVVYWVVNAYCQPLDFELLPVPVKFEGLWQRWVDTGRDTTEDSCWWRSG